MNNTILIISCVFPPEPIVSAQISENIATELAKSHKVNVLCPQPTRPLGYQFNNKEKLKDNYDVIRFNSYICPSYNVFGRLIESYSFGKHCCNYIKKNKKEIDVIYANTWPLLAQLLIVSIAKKHKIPIVIHIQDIYPESLSNKIPIISKWVNFILRPLDRYILKNSTSIIAISDKMKSYLARTRKINPDKINIIHNWQDESTFVLYEQTKLTNIDNSVKNPFTFMYLGNIGPVANIELLIEAFIKVNLQETKLVIAGSGSMKEKLRKQCMNQNNIEFLNVPNGKVPEIQSKADVMLLPIKKGAASSSIPSKLPAYMFSAKPILACVDSDSDTAIAIQESDCGWIVQPENVSILSTKLQETFNLPKEELAKRGENGKKYALLHFSKKENLKKIVSMIINA